MAKYRPVLCAIWGDPDFEDYSKDQKLIFLYLITTDKTTESGIYAVTPKAISNETGIPVSVVKETLGNGFKNVSYDFENRCVFVHNFLRYNGRGRKDLILKSLQADAKQIRTPLWEMFQKTYPAYCDGIEFSSPHTPLKRTNSISISIDDFKKSSPSVPKDLNTEKKNKHLEYVFLTSAEYERLCVDFGKATADSKIEDLDNYIGQDPARAKRYKDHNRTIRAWMKKDGVKVKALTSEPPALIHCPGCMKEWTPQAVMNHGGLCPACDEDLKGKLEKRGG